MTSVTQKDGKDTTAAEANKEVPLERASSSAAAAPLAPAHVPTAAAAAPVAETSQPTETTFRDDDVVPRIDVFRASPMIFAAVQQFSDRLIFKSAALKQMLNFETMAREPAMVVVSLQPNEKNIAKEHIVIWFNASDGMTSGGRAVEIGYGPNYYTTFGELKEAIKSALDSEPEVDE